MKINIPKKITGFINFIFDQCMPPVIRDSKLIMFPFFKLFFGKNASIYINFKEKLLTLSKEDIGNLYKKTFNPSAVKRKTDLQARCIKIIESSIEGSLILDVGCGSGYLTKRLADKHQVIGIDFKVETVKNSNPKFISGNILSLPFSNNSFDTVICTHVLEHIPNLQKAVEELRRVTRKKLIIVVPLQRPYLYTFNAHIHFFTYPYQFILLMNPKTCYSYKVIEKELLYCEETNT